MIISISGHMSSGKDTVGKIINYLLTGGEDTYCAEEGFTTIESFLKYYEDARNIVHPETWTNSLMADYIGGCELQACLGSTYCGGFKAQENCDAEFSNWIITDTRFENEVKAVKDREGICIKVVRDILDNSKLIKEVTEKAHNTLVEKYGSKLWKYNNSNEDYEYLDKYQKEVNELYDRFYEELQPKLHVSETALDDFEDWDFVIENNGSLEELVESVKQILIKLNLL